MSEKKRYRFSHRVVERTSTSWPWGADGSTHDLNVYYVFRDQDGEHRQISAIEFWIGNPFGNYLRISKRLRAGDPA